LPEPPSIAATRGTLVHAVLEALFDLPAGQRTLPAAQALVPSCWAQLQARQPELSELVNNDDPRALRGWVSAAQRLLAGYFQMEDPAAVEPAAREMALAVELPSGLTLRGYVDRLDSGPDGSLRVIDYKTGRSPGPQGESAAMFQLRFYALALFHQLGRLPKVLQLMYLSDGVILRLVPEPTDLKATTVRVEALWAAIEQATTTADWRANPGRACGWCAHRSICPARDGAADQPEKIDLTEGASNGRGSAG
jgi:putative RecB family exonuclease